MGFRAPTVPAWNHCCLTGLGDKCTWPDPGHRAVLGQVDEATQKPKDSKCCGWRKKAQIGQLPGAQTTELVVAASVTQCHFALHTGTVRSRCCGTGASSLPSLTATKFTNSFGTIHPPAARQGKHRSGRGGGEGAELSAPSCGSQSHLGQPGTPCSLTLLLQPRNTHFHQNTQNTHRRWISEEGRTRRRLRRSGGAGRAPPKQPAHLSFTMWSSL